MTVQGYISVFRMDQPNYEFNRIEFIKAFGEEFRKDVKTLFEATGRALPYLIFKDTVKAYQKKFNDISFTKKGKNLSPGLWKVFYKLHVVPVRADLYPESQKRIQEFKRLHQSTR